MIEVNVSNLRSDISVLNGMLDELEEIKLNLFNELKDSCINWYDGNSLIFDGKMQLDSREADEIITTLKDKRAVYDFVCLKYSEIGNHIKCNLEHEESLIAGIDSCINVCDSIKGSLSSGIIDLSPARKDVEHAVEILTGFKAAIKEVLTKIRDFERSISTKISALELVNIEELDFDIETEAGV